MICAGINCPDIPEDIAAEYPYHVVVYLNGFSYPMLYYYCTKAACVVDASSIYNNLVCSAEGYCSGQYVYLGRIFLALTEPFSLETQEDTLSQMLISTSSYAMEIVYSNHDIINTSNGEIYHSKMALYNGLALPELPNDISEGAYSMIYQSASDSNFYCLSSNEKVTATADATLSIPASDIYILADNVWQAGDSSSDAVSAQAGSVSLIWANYSIMYDDMIYFPESIGHSFYRDVRLPTIPDWMLEKYPYVGITRRLTNVDTDEFLLGSDGEQYFCVATNSPVTIVPGDNNTFDSTTTESEGYVVSYFVPGVHTYWSNTQKSSSAYIYPIKDTVSIHEQPVWSNYDILNASSGAIWFESSIDEDLPQYLRIPTTVLKQLKGIGDIVDSITVEGLMAYYGFVFDTIYMGLTTTLNDSTISYKHTETGETISRVTIDRGFRKNIIDATLPAVTSVGLYTFDGCSNMAIVDMPVCTFIGQYAFNNCSALGTVIIRTTDSTCELGADTVFKGTPIESGTGYIYVPSALVDSYKVATNWSTYANQIRAIEDYPDICGTSE